MTLQADIGIREELLYHFCRLQLPAIVLSSDACRMHLQRTFDLYRSKDNASVTWDRYLDNLYPLDWYVTSACLEGNERAWQQLFNARAGRSDCLLLDALRARAVRLFPRDEERQESAVQEFWSFLVVAETGSLPVLARYDGQRPLVPWLIRVFQNWHISQLRKNSCVQALPDDDLAMPLPEAGPDSRWREVFSQATRDWLGQIQEGEILLLGLRLRYRMSQRDVAQLLKVHEGTISRRTDQLRDRCLDFLQEKLVAEGWTGNGIHELIQAEMHHLLLDDPRLSAQHLAQILSQQGKKLPA